MLLGLRFTRFSAANELVFAGEYPSLRPGDVDELIRGHPLPQFTALALREMQLPGPLPVSTLTALGAKCVGACMPDPGIARSLFFELVAAGV
jgi:hypothetical protein